MRQPPTIQVTRAATNAVPSTEYRFLALMDAADIADPSLTLTITFSLDGRVVWGPNAWPCGTKDRNGNFITPHFEFKCPEVPPTNWTVRTDIPRAINLGLDITQVDPTIH